MDSGEGGVGVKYFRIFPKLGRIQKYSWDLTGAGNFRLYFFKSGDMIECFIQCECGKEFYKFHPLVIIILG